MSSMRATLRLGVLLALIGALAGCGGQPSDTEPTIASSETLPGPERAGDSVTGMPAQPGPGQIGSPPPLDPTTTSPALDNDGSLVGVDGDDDGLPLPEASSDASSDPATPPGEPGPDEAVAVVREYYEAINAGAYDRAYRLWSGQGEASGQSPQQFADGFDGTAEVSVEVMAPGRIDPAAGSRYIEVPVALSAVHRDGSTHNYVGAYTLRRAVVDGASPEQRAWRIGSADIREVRP